MTAERHRPEVTEELDRELGLGGAIALGVGTMIAAGIFVLSGLAVSNVGAAAIVAFLIAAVVAGFTAAAYAEFAAIYPESGGGYMYVANVFETDLTYLVGWAMILGYPASAAFYMSSFSDWFFRFIYPAFHISEALPYWMPGLLILALLVGVNVKGTKETGLFQIVVTALKVALIFVFLYGGLQAFDGGIVTESFADNIDDLAEIGLTSALVFITFFGFEAIATNAEEIEQPGVTVPRAIFFSMGFVTLVYTLVVLVVVLAVNDGAFLAFLADKAGLPDAETARRFVADNGEVSMGRAAQYYLGDVGFYVIIVGALLSMVSAANATVMAGSRVKLAMARRQHLPAAIESVHERFRTPANAVLLTGGLIAFFILFFTVIFGETPGALESHPPFELHLGIEALAHFADFMLLTGLIFVNVAVVRSRRKDPRLERPFRVPLVPWVPILAVLANFVLLLNVEFKSLVLGFAAMTAGAIFWLAWKAKPPSAREIEEITPTAVAEYRTPGEASQLLVALANPEHVGPLMRTAIAIARDREAELLVMSAVIVPDQTPLSEGRRYAGRKREVLERALEAAEEAGVPASGIIRIAHHATDAIVHTVQQHGADAVLLGWQGAPSRRKDVVLGTTVDRVLRDTEGDVIVERLGPEDERLETILLPTAGGPNAELAGRVAAALARARGGRIVAAHVLAPDASEAERREAQALLDEAIERLAPVDGETCLLPGRDVASSLVQEAARHDLTVIGATRQGLLPQLLVGDIPHALADRTQGPLIMVKRTRGVASRLRRWLPWR